MTTDKAIDREQALAGLRVLVHLVRADGHISEEEREALQPSFEALELGEDEVEELLAEDVNLHLSLRDVTDPEVQRTVLMAAYAVARADGTVAEEQVVIDTAREAWDVDVERLGLMDELVDQAKRDFALREIAAIEDPVARGQQIERLVRSRAIGLALLALPPPNLVTESLGAFIQFRMVRAIGHLHGYAGDSKMTAALLGSLLGVITVHAGLGALVRMVPVWGSAVGAAASYATTYGIGYAANAYFEADGALDDKALKRAFRSFRVKGKKTYDEKDVEARWTGRKTDIAELSRRFLQGEIGAHEVASKVRDDLDEA